MQKKIPMEQVVVMQLAHDIMRIVARKFKGADFRCGHVLSKKDIPSLLNMGKKQVHVLHVNPGELHEDDAAQRIARAVMGKGLVLQGPREGKNDFIAKIAGLFKVNIPAVTKINSVRSIILSTLHDHSCVSPGKVVAGTRVIHLFPEESRVKKV